MAMAVVAAAVTAGLLMRRRNRKDKEDKVVIAIGTKNKCKVQAVAETVKLYPMLAGCTLHPYAVSSGIDEQPIGLEYTAQGARNRAKEAFEKGEKGARDRIRPVWNGQRAILRCVRLRSVRRGGVPSWDELRIRNPKENCRVRRGGEGGGEGGVRPITSVQQSGDRGRRETGGGTRTHWDTYQGEGRQEGVHDAGYQDKPHLLGEQKVVL